MNPELLALYYGGYPQRWVTGLPPTKQESPLTINGNAVLAYSKLALDPTTPTIQKRYTDGNMAFHVGEGDTQARVNEASSDTQALRNLNFAMANLAAYNRYVNETKPAENLKAKREADLKAAQDRLQETRLRNGLDLYNKVNGVRYLNWPGHLPASARELWAKQAQEVTRLQRESNPFQAYATTIFNSRPF